MVMQSKVGQWGFDEPIKTTKRVKERFKIKGRSIQTHKNKIKKMKKLYKNLYRASQKKKAKNPQGKYFSDKYSTVDSFLKAIKIKEANVKK